MRVLAAAFSAALVATITATIAVAAGTGDASSATLTPAQALDTDARSYAARHGVTVAEARGRLGEQASLAEALERLERQFPDRFAGGVIEHAPSHRAVARFTGAVPDGAALVAGAGVHLVGGARRTLAELEARADEVHAAMARLWNTTLVTSFDVRTGVVEVSIETPASLHGLSTDALRRRLPAAVRGDDVRTEFAAGPVAIGQTTRGGAKAPSDSGGYCTTGFVVRKNGADGFVTAGHCDNSLDYLEPESGGDQYDTTYQSGHRGTWGDFQWHTTPDPEAAEFYSGDTSRRDVLDLVTSISRNDFFCKNGRTSGYGCSDVYRTSLTARFDGIDHKKMVAMEDSITLDGDSGGPWFINNDAVGVHSCRLYKGGAWRSCFSRMEYIYESLGASLLVKG
jgi:hypothetical protein